MARVALDGQALQVEGWADRGVGRYVTGYAAALARQGALAALLLAPELPPARGLPDDLVAAGLVRWDGAEACRALTASGPVAHHLTAPFLHYEPGAPAGLGVAEHWARAGAARVVLLHDLIPLRAPRHYLGRPGHESRYRARAAWVAQADLVVTNSEYTRREAIAVLGCDPDRVATVGIGVAPFFFPPDGTDEELWRFHFPGLAGRPHLVTVGGSDARKGTSTAIAALGLLVARELDLSLLVVGHLAPAFRAELETLAGACGVADRVVFAGAVGDEVLRACYRRAALSVMPSLAEGAGLPVLESAACGTPALASATTALAETAAAPAALFDPAEPGALADAVAAALEDAPRRAAILSAQQALAAASTWDAVAARAVAAIDGLGGRAGPARAEAPPPRLAVVGWPATDQQRLGALLAGWPGPVDLVDAAAVGPVVRLASYDAVVYVIRGVPGDGAVLAAAGRHPGWLWLWGSAGRGVGRSELEPLVRRSAGLVVDAGPALDAVRLALRPGTAPPPVVALPEGEGRMDALVSALRPAATV
ncbi:MAG TPA: glycosyltransferase, partial [Acidimicrobiales bacterium]|nr:glycosyltransferase [Acidimicrobiales bacterium]